VLIGRLIYLWIKAHTGNFGKEFAEILAKHGINEGVYVITLNEFVTLY